MMHRKLTLCVAGMLAAWSALTQTAAVQVEGGLVVCIGAGGARERFQRLEETGLRFPMPGNVARKGCRPPKESSGRRMLR